MTWINEREVISSLLPSRSEKNTNKEESEEKAHYEKEDPHKIDKQRKKLEINSS